MRLLAADIGYGTTDILVYDSGLPIENCPKLVIPSRTQQLAAAIRQATAAGKAVAMGGVTMGGGPCGKALKQHLQAGLPFFASPAAALTFNDDLEKVAAWGVTIVDYPAGHAPAAVQLTAGDLEPDVLFPILSDLGIDTAFDGAAIAVQDHGFAPGASNRKHRFSLWREQLRQDGGIDSLAFRAAEIPAAFTRMRAAASLLEATGDVIAMDTGPAALRGALATSLDTLPAGTRMVANAGNGHTLAAIVTDGAITGLVEHHTSRLDAPGFAALLEGLASGRLTNDEVFADGGHGCLPPEQPVAIEKIAPVIVTGPRREGFREARIAMQFAAPFGDMMLSGCYGLVGAWLRLA
ncbi:MAG: DUF1786 family protein [Thermoleophilia bacterium]